jgi:hypothetical protein
MVRGIRKKRRRDETVRRPALGLWQRREKRERERERLY